MFDSTATGTGATTTPAPTEATKPCGLTMLICSTSRAVVSTCEPPRTTKSACLCTLKTTTTSPIMSRMQASLSELTMLWEIRSSCSPLTGQPTTTCQLTLTKNTAELLTSICESVVSSHS